MATVIKDYRLDYPNSEFLKLPQTNGYGVIKFKNTEPSSVDYAIGAKGDTPPNTRDGMLGNKSRIIFEYKMNKRDFIDGDVLEVYNADGSLKATYTYMTDYIYNSKKVTGWVK